MAAIPARKPNRTGINITHPFLTRISRSRLAIRGSFNMENSSDGVDWSPSKEILK
jgi:hypothetical protein